MNSFIAWIGGKKLLRKEIVKRFPEEGFTRYVEVFGGAGWVLFEKEQGKELEVFNDRDSNLINLYRCIKYHCGELQRELEWLTISREQFFDSKSQLDSQGYVRSATYFSDEWPMNFWNSDMDDLDQELLQIKRDGFDSIILIIPWREFQPEIEPVVFNEKAFDSLKEVMEAARGHYAGYLTENHDMSDIFGDSSPIGRLYELNGYVLLIGVGYDKNTSLHLADVRAEYPGKHTMIESSAIRVDGKRVWKDYETLAVDGGDFLAIGEAFEQTGQVRHVSLGNGILSMMSQRALVDFAVEWIGENRK